MEKNYKCKTCRYHDPFSWVCSNADSSYVADFTDDEDWCSAYEFDSQEFEHLDDDFT